MRSRTQWSTIVALVAWLVSAGTERAVAQPGPPPGMGGPPPLGALARLLPPPDRWAELGLSDAQQDRIAALHDAEARAGVRAEADARLAELDLARLLERDEDDAAAVAAAVARVAAARADLLRAHVEMIRGARRVLSPEQRRKLGRLGPPAQGPGGPHRGERGLRSGEE